MINESSNAPKIDVLYINLEKNNVNTKIQEFNIEYICNINENCEKLIIPEKNKNEIPKFTNLLLVYTFDRLEKYVKTVLSVTYYLTSSEN